MNADELEKKYGEGIKLQFDSAIKEVNEHFIDNPRVIEGIQTIDEILGWERIKDLLDVGEPTVLSEIGSLLGKVMNKAVEQLIKDCGDTRNPCLALQKKIKAVNTMFAYEKLKDQLGIEDVFAESFISQRLFPFKLNYDVRVRGTQLYLHFRIRDLELIIKEVSPDGNFCMEGRKALEYVTINLPEAVLEYVNALKEDPSTEFLTPEAIEALARLRYWELSNPPLIIEVKLNFRCDGTSVKDLIMDLSYDYDGVYIVAGYFSYMQEVIIGPDSFGWKQSWDEIRTDRSIDRSYGIVGLIELANEQVLDLSRWGIRQQRRRTVNIQCKDWNILSNKQLAVKTYEQALMRWGLLFGPADFRNSAKIRLELVHDPIK